MNNRQDLSAIANNYANKTDSEIIYIATQNAKGLKPGVFEIIEKELIKRNLNLNYLEGIKAQNKQYTLKEINELSLKLRSLPCPLCGNKTSKLNGTVLHTVKSFIILTTHKKEPIVACPDCLDKKSQESINSTALLGWWGFPWGLIKTPYYIYNNIKSKKQNRNSESNQALIGFTLENVGQIESYKEDTEKLKQLLKNYGN